MHWLANSITPQYKPELPPTAAEIAVAGIDRQSTAESLHPLPALFAIDVGRASVAAASRQQCGRPVRDLGVAMCAVRNFESNSGVAMKWLNFV